MFINFAINIEYERVLRYNGVRLRAPFFSITISTKQEETLWQFRNHSLSFYISL